MLAGRFLMAGHFISIKIIQRTLILNQIHLVAIILIQVLLPPLDNGYITDFGFSDEFDYLFLPTADEGSDGRVLSDYVTTNTGDRIAFKDTDKQSQYAVIKLIKTLILSNGEYKKYEESLHRWQTVSTVLPSSSQFQEHGMEDLSISDREVQPVLNSPISMTREELGEGKVFKGKVDLKKIIDLRKLEVK